MQLGKNAIVYAAEGGLRDIVEILFPCTKPIASLPDWSVDGIINAKKHIKVYIKTCITESKRLFRVFKFGYCV
jgi:hypothetical protein